MSSNSTTITDISLKQERNDLNDEQSSKRNYIEIDDDNNELTLLSDDDDEANYMTNDDLIEINEDGEENSLNGLCNNIKNNNNNDNNNNGSNSSSNNFNINGNSQNNLNKRRRIHKNSTYFTANQMNSADEYASNEKQFQQHSFYMNEIIDSQNSHLNVRLPFIIDFFLCCFVHFG